jgi:hypothetical protein
MSGSKYCDIQIIRRPTVSDNVALVVGARGVIGGNLVRHLQDLDGRQVIASRAAAANQQERSVTCPSTC